MAAGAATKEVRQQLQAQGGEGNVWIEDWGSRFQEHLGGLRDFIATRSEFRIVPQGGRRFSVALVGGGGGKATGGSAYGKAGCKGRGRGGIVQLALARGGATAYGKAKGGGGGNGWSKAAATAINEARLQLTQQGGSGKVFLENYRERFQDELGSLRDFLESHPDKFTLDFGPRGPATGGSFTVSLANRGGAGAGGGGGWSGRIPAASPAAAAKPRVESSDGGWNPTVAEAIREIRAQLEAQGGTGSVWIDGWGQRFQAQLGGLKEFLESRPDKFALSHGPGRKFVVALVAGGGGGAQVVQESGTKRSYPWEASENKRAKVTNGDAKTSAATDPESLAEEAMCEIQRQLNNPRNTEGKVWIKTWNQRYKDSLGNFRDFLDCNPDKFVVLPGDGNAFTVSLA